MGVKEARGRRLAAPFKVLYEAGAIVVEAIRIPISLWLRVAEIAGRGVLAAWRVAWPVARRLGARTRRLLTAFARAATPARAAVVVALVGIGALVASQYVDYRAIEIGAPASGPAAGLVPPPQVSAETARSAHGDWVLVLAGVALLVCLFAVAMRRRGVARLIVPIAVAVLVIAIAVDRPAGERTGQIGLAYEGAHGTLLDGYAAEIAAGSVLVLGGVLLALYLPAREPRRARSRRRRGERRPRRREAGGRIGAVRARKAGT